MLRDVFAEHRAELAQVNQAHTDQLAQALAQRPHSADPPAADTMELRAALLEQANVQREANEAVASIEVRAPATQSASSARTDQPDTPTEEDFVMAIPSF